MSTTLQQMVVLPLLGTASLLLACGSEDVPPPRDCALTMTLSGAVDMQRDGPQLCSATGIHEPGPRKVVSFIELTPSLQVSFTLEGMSEAAVGTFVASFAVVKQPGPGSWSNAPGDCTVTITDHSVFDKELGDAWMYRFSGTGSCSKPATAGPNAEGAIEVSDFSFKALVGWNQ